MPITPTYPGVYIEEISSGVRTITGVATSITAFLGRALRGPVNEPTVINNYGDFESLFGGQAVDYPLSYTVRDFFNNGGSQALIVRLFNNPSEANAKKAGAAVLKAIQTAAKAANATPQTVVAAATAELPNHPNDPDKTAAQHVADAATSALPDQAAASSVVALAARTEANSITTDPGKDVAAAVATSAETTATAANPTPSAVSQTANTRANDLKALAQKIQTGAAGANAATVDASVNAVLNDAAQIPVADNPIIGKIVTAANPAGQADGPKAIAAVQRAVTDFNAAADRVVAAASKSANQATQSAIKAILAAASNAEETAVDHAPIQTLRAKLTIPTQDTKTLELEAASPGNWGQKLTVFVDYEAIDDVVAERYGLTTDDLFNLTISDGVASPERITNVSVTESRRRLDRVLEEESQLLRVPVDPITKKPILSDKIPSPNPLKINPSNDKEKPEPYKPDENIDINDGELLNVENYTGSEKDKTGLYALEKADLFNLLSIPPDERDGDTPIDVYQAAVEYSAKKRAFLIVDPPAAWGKVKELAAAKAKAGLGNLGLTGIVARNAAIYFPRIIKSDPLREGQLDTFAPSGVIAGIFARTDVQRGVWKAPAGIDATLSGIQGLQVNLTDDENGLLNPIGINSLRNFRVYGNVVWGSRTLRGADQLGDEYKYVPVRRFVLFLEESLYRGTQWVVFEPNDEPLWAQIRLNIGVFLNDLFRQGAFQGKSPKEAYFVKCDSETTTQSDIDRGIVNIVVGFAPLKPAEFVIIKIQQINRLAPS